MTNQNRLEFIKQRLTDAFTPSHLEVIDEGYMHINHKGAENGAGHYAVIIAAESFQNKKLLDCHRMIYDAIGKSVGNDIHALRIKVIPQ